MPVLKREAARFEVERIMTGTALGEVDHPSYNSRYFRSLNRESQLPTSLIRSESHLTDLC